MNTYTISKYIFGIGMFLIVLAGLMFCFSLPSLPSLSSLSRQTIVKKLEERHLPTPQLADTSQLLSILNTF